MKEMAQNNPILYIFLNGVDTEVSTAIQEIQAKRIGTTGIGYIFINSDTRHEDTLKDIEYNHSRFITRGYQYSGEIKVNYLLNPDDPFSLQFSEIKERLEYRLRYLYPTVIHTDIFAVMDDVTSIFSEARRHRSDVINILKRMQSDTCSVYILSNINSGFIYDPDNKNNIYHSIALLALIKDCVSLKTSTAKANFYSERYFKEDCMRSGGSFMTIGYANIKKPMEIIYKILVAKLLVFMDKGEYSVPVEIELPKPVISSAMMAKENLLGLPKYHTITPAEKKNLTNGQALDILYGDSLDMFFELNFEEHEEENILSQIPYDYSDEFYAVYYITAADGVVMARLTELLDENADAAIFYDTEYNNWVKASGSYSVTKPLFKDIDEYPVLLASDYLRFKHTKYYLDKQKRLIEQAINTVTEFHENLVGMKSKVDDLVSESNKIMKDFELDETFYVSRLVRYLEDLDGHDEYFGIYRQMYAFLKDGRLDEYTGLLRCYAYDKMSEIFDAPVIDEEFLMNYTEKNKIFNVFLKSGGKNLHIETNILLDVNSRLALDKKKVNLFFVDNEHQIDILYHAGGFDKEDLYYDEQQQ